MKYTSKEILVSIRYVENKIVGLEGLRGQLPDTLYVRDSITQAITCLGGTKQILLRLLGEATLDERP
jgi:hypothetical protein